MRLLILLALVGVVTPAVAEAQGILVTVIGFENRNPMPDITDLATLRASPINRSDCDNNSNITFRYTMVPTTPANLHYFWGSGCMTTTSRTDTTDMSCIDLMDTEAINMAAMVDDTIPVSTLIDCAAGGSGSRMIWVLAINATTDDVTTAEIARFDLAFDFDGPAAPASFAAAAGESAATLSWEGSTDNIREYEIYFVPNGCSDGVVTTTISDPPPASLLVDSVEGSNTTYSLSYPSTVAIGSESAVAIRAIDMASNPSALSAVTCVSRIEVTTWWDTYCSESPTPESCTYSGCSAQPGQAALGASGLLCLLALGALLFVRRRRKLPC